MAEAGEQRTDRILGFLADQGLRGCPICGEGHFGVGPQHIILATEHHTDPSEASAVVPVLCGNCGYMMLFGTKMLPDEGR
jgi:hypothetical protein